MGIEILMVKLYDINYRADFSGPVTDLCLIKYSHGNHVFYTKELHYFDKYDNK